MLVQGPTGEYITETEFARLTEDGCAYCTANVTVADDRYMSWTHDNRPVCSYCTSELTEYGELTVGGLH